jgi:hypothetical protein
MRPPAKGLNAFKGILSRFVATPAMLDPIGAAIILGVVGIILLFR